MIELANRREAPHCTVGQCRDERRVNDWGSPAPIIDKKVSQQYNKGSLTDTWQQAQKLKGEPHRSN